MGNTDLDQLGELIANGPIRLAQASTFGRGTVGHAAAGGGRGATYPTPGGDLVPGVDIPRSRPARPAAPDAGAGAADPDLPGSGRRLETRGMAATAAAVCVAACPNCKPRLLGVRKPNNYGPNKSSVILGYHYQNFVCPWHEHYPQEYRIIEWHYGVDFDGLDPDECLLYEAKHGYDSYLVQDDWRASGRPEISPKADFADMLFRRIVVRAGVQIAIVAAHPEARLRYVFSESSTHVFLGKLLIEAGHFKIETEHRPWGGL